MVIYLNRFYWFGSQPKEEGLSFGVIVRLLEASGFLNSFKCMKCVYVLVVYVGSNGIADG